jgi:cyanoexosortase B-associated protein
LLALLAAIAAIPGYFQGHWQWSDVPLVMNIYYLKNVRLMGLKLPGWQMGERTDVQIGEHFWGVQTVEREGEAPVTLYFMPQEYYRMQPQVEWVDLQGVEGWKTDSPETLTFSLPGKAGSEVKANFFRAWRDQTFAVVQWYAWYQGGSPDPAHWFWADQQAQLRRQRVSWVAVCLKIPIDPLSDLNSHRAFAKSLAQTVQVTLDREVFSK